MKTRAAVTSILAISSVLWGSPSWAADILAKEPPPGYQQLPDWSGPFVEGHFAYSWLNSNTDFVGTDNFNTGPAVHFASTIGLPLTYDLSNGSFGGGAGIGYERQFGMWIFGAKADWNYAGLQAGSGGVANLDPFLTGIFGPLGKFSGNTMTLNTQASLKQYGTIQGRVGIQPRQDLPLALFIGGGLAGGDATVAHVLSVQGPVIAAFGGPFATQNSDTVTRWGPVASATLEYEFAIKWYAFADYSHIWFGSQDSSVPSLNGGNIVSHTSFDVDAVHLGVKKDF